MRRLVNYLRQLFCAHEFAVAEQWCEGHWGDPSVITSRQLRVSFLCKRCGYHYWRRKFG